MTRTPLKIYLPLLGEFVAALAMLAILILSFAPVTPANSILSSASASDTIAVQSSWCGDPLPGGDAIHVSACHACRVDAVKLPDAPCEAEQAFAGPMLAPLVVLTDAVLPQGMKFPNGTRAPPVAV